jgi:two-component sensor histidine kinase
MTTAASDAAAAAVPPPPPAWQVSRAPGLRRAGQVGLLAGLMLVYEAALRIRFDHADARWALDVASMAAVHLATAALLLGLLDVCARGLRRWPVALRLVSTLSLCIAGAALLQIGSVPWREPVMAFSVPVPFEVIVRFMLGWSFTVSALLLAVHELSARRHSAAQALHETQLERLRLEREADAARLALLQAQIEPHFVFNALANVRRLLRTDAAAASALCDDLLGYFEHALPSLRDAQVPLGREAELARAYLAVHQVRMGARLRFEIDVPPELRAQRVPSLSLLTLVENALEHGLQPLVEGGRIRITARAQQDRLELCVADDGRGMGSGSGHGTGLANLRARLRSLHGAAGQLQLAVGEPRGVRASVTLPLQR